ncbi:hypothetical protein ABT158_13920 [Nonomuraea sp. NPDC001636]|uniref:hypothetical protein n=1 Tax=Nonomuraea sp. NPDC001636 TaxID=3154391 RepID=UPI0033246947
MHLLLPTVAEARPPPQPRTARPSGAVLGCAPGPADAADATAGAAAYVVRGKVVNSAGRSRTMTPVGPQVTADFEQSGTNQRIRLEVRFG